MSLYLVGDLHNCKDCGICSVTPASTLSTARTSAAGASTGSTLCRWSAPTARPTPNFKEKKMRLNRVECVLCGTVYTIDGQDYFKCPVCGGGNPDNAPGVTVLVPPNPSGGVKYDSGKPPLSWIPRKSLEAEALVFAYGAKKYGRNNYKQGMDWSRMVDAILRHVYAFSDGEVTDTESGLPHLAHAKANLSMLMFYVDKERGNDDRNADINVSPKS